MQTLSKMITIIFIGFGLATILVASVVTALPFLFLGVVALIWAISLDSA